MGADGKKMTAPPQAFACGGVLCSALCMPVLLVTAEAGSSPFAFSREREQGRGKWVPPEVPSRKWPNAERLTYAISAGMTRVGLFLFSAGGRALCRHLAPLALPRTLRDPRGHRCRKALGGPYKGRARSFVTDARRWCFGTPLVRPLPPAASGIAGARNAAGGPHRTTPRILLFAGAPVDLLPQIAKC